jgi:hypothetical protein
MVGLRKDGNASSSPLLDIDSQEIFKISLVRDASSPVALSLRHHSVHLHPVPRELSRQCTGGDDISLVIEDAPVALALFEPTR